MANAYTEASIKTLSPLEHIRLRPGMYIGRLGSGTHAEDGIYVLLIVRLLARRLVIEWEGVGDAAGEPLALSEPALDALMERDDMLSPFWDAVIGRPDPVSAEGNG